MTIPYLLVVYFGPSALALLVLGILSALSPRGRAAQGGPMNLTVLSYGNRARKEPPPGTDLIVDCRGLPNPYSVRALQSMTGLDEPVRRFLAGRPGVRPLLEAAEAGVRGGAKTVAFCCLGGTHRSVYVAELFAHERRKKGDDVTITHLELP